MGQQATNRQRNTATNIVFSPTVQVGGDISGGGSRTRSTADLGGGGQSAGSGSIPDTATGWLGNPLILAAIALGIVGLMFLLGRR